MERIFTYIAAILSRILFSFHVGITLWWVTIVTRNPTLWCIIVVYCTFLLLETSITVFYRKGHEYYWFCPSIFIFTMVEIPCFVILRMKLGECWRTNHGLQDGIIKCATNATQPGLKSQIDNLGLTSLITDDEKIISGLDQTFLLLLVIGRWLLPKGEMSRDQLSQLLLIYIAAAADIVELTEIYEIRAVLDSEGITNLVIALWSTSLLQFSVTIQNAETLAQEEDIAEVERQKGKERDGELTNNHVTGRRSNRIAPALYTYKLAQRKAMERQRARRSTMDLDAIRRQATHGHTPSNSSSQTSRAKGSKLGRVLGALGRFENKVQGLIRKHIDLIQLVTPMLLQDGPFLVLRLYIAANYDVSDSNMFLFLIAKNILVILLQIYRICVLYCKPGDREEPEDDIFTEREEVRLRNVQTALTSVATATLTMHGMTSSSKMAATSSSSQAGARRKRSRAFSQVFLTKLAVLKKRRKKRNDIEQGETSCEDARRGDIELTARENGV